MNLRYKAFSRIFYDIHIVFFWFSSFGLHFAEHFSFLLRPCLRPQQPEVDSNYNFSVEMAKFLREGTRPYKDLAAVVECKSLCLERRGTVCGRPWLESATSHGFHMIS